MLGSSRMMRAKKKPHGAVMATVGLSVLGLRGFLGSPTRSDSFALRWNAPCHIPKQFRGLPELLRVLGIQ